MKVQFYGAVLDRAQGEKAIDVPDAASLSQLIDRLGARYGEPFKAFLMGEETCFFLVNGSGILATGGLDTPLRAGDTVDVLPFVDGG